MEAMLDTVVQGASVAEEQEAEATPPAGEEEISEELVELLVKEITIDGMCGVY
ncbi:mycofactocin precursor MftA [Thermomicrobium sp.]